MPTRSDYMGVPPAVRRAIDPEPRTVRGVATLLRWGVYVEGVLVAAFVSQARAEHAASDPVYGSAETQVRELAPLVEPLNAPEEEAFRNSDACTCVAVTPAGERAIADALGPDGFCGRLVDAEA